jgi:hypothetical protein
MEEFRVPVVVEIILERVTNIAMGTEIDNVNEFEELAERARTPPDLDARLNASPTGPSRRRPPLQPDRREAMPKFRRQPDHALQRACPSSTASRRPPRPASRPSSSCSPTPSGRASSRNCWTQHGLQLVLHNLPAGDWAAGERGIACHPDRVASSAPASTTAIAYANRAGREAAQLPGRQGAAGVPSRHAAPRPGRQPALSPAPKLKAAGIRLLIEPINTFDIPGFYLNRTAQAISDLDEVGATTPGCSTTSTTCSAWRASWPPHREAPAAHRPHPARRQPGPQRAGHRRDQLRLPVRATSTASATRAGSAANTSPPPPPRPAWAGQRARSLHGPPNPAATGHELTGRHDIAMPHQETTMNIGFIGLGIMGAPMAGHLIAAATAVRPTARACRRICSTPAPVPARRGRSGEAAPTSSS